MRSSTLKAKAKPERLCTELCCYFLYETNISWACLEKDKAGPQRLCSESCCNLKLLVRNLQRSAGPNLKTGFWKVWSLARCVPPSPSRGGGCLNVRDNVSELVVRHYVNIL
jgi:hypothetical protein